MDNNASPHQPNCINGWIEILHFKTDPAKIHLAKPLLKSADSLEHFKEEHYNLVGSPIPMCEYYSAIEVYRQYVAPVDAEFNIPRPFQNFDAINLCMNDAKYGRGVTTFILYPKNCRFSVKFTEPRAQYHPDLPHCLLKRRQPFSAFFSRNRHVDGEIDD